MKHVVIIAGHPRIESLGSALATAYADGALAAGAEVRRLDLARMAFDPILRVGHQPDPDGQALEPDLQRAQQDLQWAHHIAVLFPLWWAGPPALLKGFIDRVFLPGFAFQYSASGALPTRLLKGRTGRVVTTMDSPRWWNRLAQGRAAHHSINRGTLGFCGIRPVRETVLYKSRTRTPEQLTGFISRVRRVANSDVARIKLR